MFHLVEAASTHTRARAHSHIYTTHYPRHATLITCARHPQVYVHVMVRTNNKLCPLYYEPIDVYGHFVMRVPRVDPAR